MIFQREESPSVVSAAGVTSSSGSADILQYPVYSPSIEGCVYRGEGNANLVVALPSERKVIRFRKSVSGESSMEDKARRVCREVDFIRNVISGFFGSYVCVPEIIQLQETEIAKLSEKIRSSRPESRQSKEITGGYVTKFPDYTFMPENFSGSSSKSTFCVEIKPKQGFICKDDQKFKKCPYCLTQYYKVHNGSTGQLSGYCPFDIFSGQKSRMNRALEALLRSPQNNLRIFKDGTLVYDDKTAEENVLHNVLIDWFSSEDSQRCLEKFLRLMRCALMRPFDNDRIVPKVIAYERGEEFELPSRLESSLVQKVKTLLDLSGIQECDLSDGSLPCGSALERILRMQKVHRCGNDVVSWIYAKFSAILSDEMIHVNLMKNDDTSSSNHCHFITERQKKELKSKNQFDLVIPDSNLESKTNSNSYLYKKNNLGNQKTESLYKKIIDENFLKNIVIDDILNILKNYLMFCMAKDCSILLAFQEIHEKISENIESQHIIEVSTDQKFFVSIRILDLDMKNLHCIEKHCHRDNNVLQAIIAELEKKLNS